MSIIKWCVEKMNSKKIILGIVVVIIVIFTLILLASTSENTDESAGPSEVVDAIFTNNDINNDGLLNHDELSDDEILGTSASNIIKDWDSDGNGELDRHELTRWAEFYEKNGDKILNR